MSFEHVFGLSCMEWSMDWVLHPKEEETVLSYVTDK